MSKRSSKSGDSPIPKSQKLIGSQKSEDSLSLSGEPDFTFLQDSSQGNEPPDSEEFNFLAGSSPTPASSVSSLPPSFPTNYTSESDSSCPLVSQPEKSQSETSTAFTSSQFEYLDNHPSDSKSKPKPSLENILIQNITSAGISSTARTVLENNDLKTELMNILCMQSHKSLKDNLKKSQLCADKTDKKLSPLSHTKISLPGVQRELISSLSSPC